MADILNHLTTLVTAFAGAWGALLWSGLEHMRLKHVGYAPNTGILSLQYDHCAGDKGYKRLLVVSCD
jgi:hypothetical protein